MTHKFDTLQIHAGQHIDQETRSCAPPLYQTASYVFKSAQHAADLFELKEAGHIYSRISNPTVAALEERLSALENGVGALAVASGHAAQFLTIVNLLKPGQNIVSSPYLYGGTVSQFKHSFRSFGVDSRIAASDKLDDFIPLIDENTRAIYMETISNPGFAIPDFEAFARLAEKHNIPFIVDNTFAGAGYLCRPFDHGASIVVESGTKWIGGHGTSIAGIIIDGGSYNWGNGKFPQFTEPAPEYHGVNFHESFGELAFLVRARGIGLRDFGPSLSPFNAYLLLQGLETLSLRMDRHCDNALKLALWLNEHPKVEKVIYPGLENDPNHANARKYLKHGFGPVLSFEIKGGKESGMRLIDSLELVQHSANVGDARTLVIQPAASTHQQLTPEEQVAAGVMPGLVRVSTGLEHIDDIIADFSQALEK